MLTNDKAYCLFDNCAADTESLPMSSFNCERQQKIRKVYGVLCDLLLAPVHDDGCLPVVGGAALYRAGSRSAVRTDAVR